jgi:hypothetical protein
VYAHSDWQERILDPADQIIGATAPVEGQSLLTADREVRRSRDLHTVWSKGLYGVRAPSTFWEKEKAGASLRQRSDRYCGATESEDVKGDLITISGSRGTRLLILQLGVLFH